MAPLAVAALLLSAAPAVADRAAAAGTLDRLADRFDGRLTVALSGRASRLAQTDLALVVRGATSVNPALVAVVRRLLSARLSARSLRSKAVWTPPPAPELAVRRAGAGGYELLLDATVAIVDGYLHLRGELRATDRLLWRDFKDPRRGALSHLHASVRVDAEVRAYQGTLKAGRGTFSERRWLLGQRPVLALATGDLDGDGRAELVVLYPDALAVMSRARRAKAGAAPSRLASVRLAPPLAAQGSRRPIGALATVDLDGDGRPEILGRSSRHAGCFAYGFDGKRLSVRAVPPELAGDRYPLVARRADSALQLLTASAEPGGDLYRVAGLKRTPAAGEPWRPEVLLPARFYGLRLARIATPKGPRQDFGAVVDGAGRLLLYDGVFGRLRTSISGVGVAFDLVDVDDDGALELIATDASEPDADDSIAVLGLGAKGLALRWRSPRLPGRVQALTHGDLDGNGKQELLAVLADHAGKTWLLVYD